MTEFYYNEPPTGAIKEISLNILILFGLFLITTLGAFGWLYFWLRKK